MKKLNFLVTLCALIAVSVSISAQVNYTYDNNGNRTGRIFVEPPSNRQSFTPIVPNKKLALNEELAMHNAMDFGISVFPTQVNELISITVAQANEQTPALVQVFDNLGKEFYTIKINSPSPEQINFSSVKAGIYNISIRIKDQQLFYKVVKGN